MTVAACFGPLAFEELGQFADFGFGIVRVFNRSSDAALKMCLKNIGLDRCQCFLGRLELI